MMFLPIFFYLLSFLAIIVALNVVLQRNPVSSVFSLILLVSIIAILLLFLGAEYISLLLITIYVGAVAVTMLYVVMFLDTKEFIKQKILHPMSYIYLVSIILAGTIAVILLKKGNLIGKNINTPALNADTLSKSSNISAFADVLFNDYYFLIYIITLLLFSVSVICTSILGDGIIKPGKRASMLKQSNKKFGEGIKVLSIPSDEGAKV